MSPKLKWTISSKPIEPEPLWDIKILMFSKPTLSEALQRRCINGSPNLSFLVLLFLLPGSPPTCNISHSALQNVGSWDPLHCHISVGGSPVVDNPMTSLPPLIPCGEEGGDDCWGWDHLKNKRNKGGEFGGKQKESRTLPREMKAFVITHRLGSELCSAGALSPPQRNRDSSS